MEKIKIVDATFDNVQGLKGNIAEIHNKEAIAFSGVGIDTALDICVQRSYYAKLVLINDKPVAVFGVVPENDSPFRYVGFPYCVTINQKEFSKTIVKYSKHFVYVMKTLFPMLANFVGIDNEVSIRWLKWCGFKFCDTIYEFNGNKFYKFVMED